MKIVVNAMDREGRVYTFLQQRLPWISLETLKASICHAPQMWVLMKGLLLNDTLSAPELSAWWLIKSVVTKFLGNKKSA